MSPTNSAPDATHSCLFYFIRSRSLCRFIGPASRHIRRTFPPPAPDVRDGSVPKKSNKMPKTLLPEIFPRLHARHSRPFAPYVPRPDHATPPHPKRSAAPGRHPQRQPRTSPVQAPQARRPSTAFPQMPPRTPPGLPLPGRFHLPAPDSAPHSPPAGTGFGFRHPANEKPGAPQKVRPARGCDTVRRYSSFSCSA